MKHTPVHIRFVLIVDLLLLVISFGGIYQLSERATIPGGYFGMLYSERV